MEIAFFIYEFDEHNNTINFVDWKASVKENVRKLLYFRVGLPGESGGYANLRNSLILTGIPMTIKNLIITTLIFLLWGCKKGEPGKPVIPQKPIGERLFNLGDTTGGSEVYGISKTPDNNIIISGTKELFNNSVGYVSYYPQRIVLDHSSLEVLSAAAPLANIYGNAVQSRQSGDFIYTLITLADPSGNPINQVEVIKTDTSKKIIWQKTFNGITTATSLELLSDGNLLIEGNYGSDATGSTNSMVLLLMDPNGNSIFNKQYTGQFSSSSFDVLEEGTNFTSVAFSLASSSVYLNILKPSLLKIDFSGNVISSSPFDNFFPGGIWHYFTSFHLTKKIQGGYILTSTFVDTAGGAVDENFYLKFLNPDGSVSKSANLWIDGTPVFRVADVLQTQNGNVYALVCLDTGTDFATEIIEYDSQGNYLNSAGISMDRYPMGLVEAENNNIIVIQDYAAANSISVMKLNLNLRVL
jgi:hypothetical protein